jgi:hypothetical protein
MGPDAAGMGPDAAGMGPDADVQSPLLRPASLGAPGFDDAETIGDER